MIQAPTNGFFFQLVYTVYAVKMMKRWRRTNARLTIVATSTTTTATALGKTTTTIGRNHSHNNSNHRNNNHDNHLRYRTALRTAIAQGRYKGMRKNRNHTKNERLRQIYRHAAMRHNSNHTKDERLR